MDVETIRRKNFSALRAEKTITQISILTDIDYTYLSRMEKGSKPFSEKKARQIEKRLNLPNLWLDFDHKSDNPLVREAAKALESVPDELLPAILAAIRALNEDSE